MCPSLKLLLDLNQQIKRVAAGLSPDKAATPKKEDKKEILTKKKVLKK